MKTCCFALDLRDNANLIAEYKRHRQMEHIWPRVIDSIRNSGVIGKEIYLAGNRMVMTLNTGDDFSLEARQASDKSNPVMQKWEELMWKYQKPLSVAGPGEKWAIMEISSKSDSHKRL